MQHARCWWSRASRAVRNLEGVAPHKLLPCLVALSLAIAGCGGSSTKTSTTHTTATSSAPAQQSGAATISTGPVRGTLRAANHAPRAGKLWAYVVHVTDAHGHPLTGTVDIEFLLGEDVVGRDTPPTHPIKDGRWHDNLTFPAPAVGQPLTFRAIVHTSLGTITLDWPVKVTA
jgi:hypothetical protein